MYRTISITVLLMTMLAWPFWSFGANSPIAFSRSENSTEQLRKFWQNAESEVDKSVGELTAQHEAELRKGIRIRKLIKGNRDKKWIALTFDDGPHLAFTPKLLDILKANQVKATFFVVGKQAEKYPDLVVAEVKAGHSIGNHTYHHLNLTKIPGDDAALEIQACGDVLTKLTHKKPTLFRPPGGDYNIDVATTANALGYTLVLWSDNPGDYEKPGERIIVSRVLKHVGNGSVILLHDGIQETMDILPGILQTLKRQGYEFVTVDEMIKGDSRSLPLGKQN